MDTITGALLIMSASGLFVAGLFAPGGRAEAAWAFAVLAAVLGLIFLLYGTFAKLKEPTEKSQ